MHGIDQITKMDIFYHAINYSSKGIIDAAYCEAFKRKSAEEANQLIDDLAKRNYRAPFETSGSNNRIRGGVIQLNRMSAIEGKLDALMSKMNNQERRSLSTNAVTPRPERVYGTYNHKGAYVHLIRATVG